LASRALIGRLHLKHHEPASQPRIDKPQPILRPTRGINLDPVQKFYTTTNPSRGTPFYPSNHAQPPTIALCRGTVPAPAAYGLYANGLT